MADIDRSASGIREMEKMADIVSPVHSLHPLTKLIVTICYLAVTASFHKYHFSGLAPMILYPAILFAMSGIPVGTCLYKMRFVLPLVCAVGIFNPFFDREPLLYMGGVAISGGVASMATLMLKGALCVTASFLLAATTPIDVLCAALRKIHVPRMLVTLILLTYRYVALMLDEVAAMLMAYRLRAPGQKGIRFSAWGSFLGQLLLRSMDRARELYESMLLRGFDGDFRYAERERAGVIDFIYCAGFVGFFLVCRSVDIAEVIGSFFL